MSETDFKIPSNRAKEQRRRQRHCDCEYCVHSDSPMCEPGILFLLNIKNSAKVNFLKV